ncbi:MAG TPA: flavodoxin family protein [Desulfuromonadales bacterium]|nr:flavodoxin family protein [Desulfuromonadales bacterium]
MLVAFLSLNNNDIFSSPESRRIDSTHICDALTKKLIANQEEVDYLKTRELNIDFCTNCRQCMKNPGNALGTCHINDEMDVIIKSALSAKSVVLVTPINCYDLPSIVRVMLERMGVFCYWGDEMYAPKVRDVGTNVLLGVLITTSAMPGIMVPLTTGARKSFRLFAKPLGIKKIRYYHLGFKGRKIDRSFTSKDEKKIQAVAKVICNTRRSL